MHHETTRPETFFAELRPGQLLESLFNTMPEFFFFVKDRSSRFVTASLPFAQGLGAKDVQEIIGKTDFDYSADFLAEAFVADDRRVIQTGQLMSNKVELVPSGDSLDWLSTTKVPLYGHKDDVIGLAGLSHVILDSDALYCNHPEMRKLVSFIQEHFREKITATHLASAAGISVSSVERLFRATFGVTPLMYLRKTRLNAACRLLRSGDQGLATIAATCGFRDQQGMTRAFRQELKITPLKYRRRFSSNNELATEPSSLAHEA